MGRGDIGDYEELLVWLVKNKKFSTYNLLAKRTLTKVQFFNHPFSPGEGDGMSISICLPGNICSAWEIFLHPDGSWELN